MKPYRTPLNKRRVVDNALNEMLSANSLQVEIPVEFSYRGGRKERCVETFLATLRQYQWTDLYTYLAIITLIDSSFVIWVHACLGVIHPYW